MSTLLGAEPAMSAPLPLVTAEAALVAVALAAAGVALVVAALAVRSRRGRARVTDVGVRRAPSPSSLGLADDPIVAAIGADGDRRRRVRRAGQIEPPI